jgi:hypothetical protein
MTLEMHAELVSVAEEMILDALRDAPLIPFHRAYVGVSVSQGWAKEDHALEESVDRAIFEQACECVNARLPSVEAKPHNFMNSDRFWGVHMSPRPGREWVDVLRELHGPAISDPAHVLTYSATQILERVESGEFTRGFVSEQSVRWRTRCFGYKGYEATLKELEAKRGLKLTVERKADAKAKRHRVLLKFKIVERTHTPIRCPRALNPVFNYKGEPAGLDLAVRRFIQDQLLQMRPPGTEVVRLWAFDSLRAFHGSFPGFGDDLSRYSERLSDTLRRCVVHPEVSMYWDLGCGSMIWQVGCQAKRPWAEILSEVEADRNAPDVGETYGLSAEAANLLRWVLDQPRSSLLMGCTPLVEEAVRARTLRLGEEWPSDNLAALIEVLCDEVTAQTPYVLKPVSWKTPHWGGRVDTRVRLTKTRNPGDVTNLVLRWLEARGVRRSADEVRLALESLSHGGSENREGE